MEGKGEPNQGLEGVKATRVYVRLLASGRDGTPAEGAVRGWYSRDACD